MYANFRKREGSLVGMQSMFRVRLLETTTSTNDEVKRALDAGEAEGLAVRARRQTGGYGRQGRTWASPVGGLYQSLLLRPDVPAEMLPTLSPVISLAVRRALATLVSRENVDRILIKWPNDIVVPAEELRIAYRKLCGISLEVHAGGVCVGTGVNVCRPAGDASVGGKNVPAYLPDLGFNGSIDDVGEAIITALAPLYVQWQADGFAPLLDEYNAYAYLTGRDVSVVDRAGARIAAGHVTRIDKHGRLILVDETGTEFPLSSGEAHII